MNRILRTLALFAAVLVLCPFIATADEDTDEWSGIWKTNYGTMLLFRIQGVYAGLVVGERNAVVSGKPAGDGLDLVLTGIGTGKREQGRLDMTSAGLSGKWGEDGFAAEKTGDLDECESGGPWAGPWKSTFGLVTIMQHGNHVFGAVSSAAKQGAFFGKLDGKTLEFSWSDNNGTRGKGVFTLAEDRTNAEGTWGKDESSSDGGVWRLRKMDPAELPR